MNTHHVLCLFVVQSEETVNNHFLSIVFVLVLHYKKHRHKSVGAFLYVGVMELAYILVLETSF